MTKAATASKQRPGSIARKVCVFVTVLLVVVTLVMSLVGFYVSREIVRQQVRERLRIVASTRHHIFSEYIDHQRVRIRHYANRYRAETASLGTVGSSAEKDAAMKRVLTESKQQFIGIVDAWLTDTRGKVVASTDPEQIGKDFSNDESFLHGMETAFVAAPRERNDMLVSYLTAPVSDESDRVLGVLFVASDMTPLCKLVRDHNGLGVSGDILVASLDGDDLKYFFPATLPRPETGAQAAVMKLAIDGQTSAEAVQTRLADDEVLATYQPIHLQPGVRDWGMVVKINVAEAYAPVYRLAKLLFVSQALLLVFVWLATQWLARRFTAPLDHLTRVVSQFASGQRELRAKVDSDDEIAALGDAFNQLADAVMRTEHDLEDRVLLRTGELQKEIDTRKEVQLQLVDARDVAEKANRSKSQFLANMSHEIRTPMNGILGMAQLLESGDLNPEQQSQLMAMQQCALWLLQLLNDILDFSKIEAGMLSLEKVPFDFRDCVDSTVATLAARGFDKDLELICRIAPNVPVRMVSDPGRLRQILFNLIGNAIKFTNQGHVYIEITARELEFAKVELTIDVVDTGVGIAAANQQHIFEAFRQADSSTTREFGGTGLGLSISSQLVEAMDGKIELESELGAGSRFRVRMPMRFLQPSPNEVDPLRGTDFRVLVVDDHPRNLETVCEMLESWGLTTLRASSGQDAVDLLANQTVSIVLLDNTLGDLAARPCVSKIRQQPDCEKLPVVMMHGAYTPTQIDWWKQEGIDHLSKPVGHRRLRELLLHRLLGIVPRPSDDSTQVKLTAASGQALRVLLVEDSLVNRQVALGLLRRLKCDVDVATHGGEAVQHVARRRYDVVLMDVQMPVMDGIKATVAIRKGEAGTKRHLPIIAMTAAAMKGDRQRCFDAGMDGYISKPVTQESLVLEVTRVLGSNGGKGDSSDSRIWSHSQPAAAKSVAPADSRRGATALDCAEPKTSNGPVPEPAASHLGLNQLCTDFSEKDALTIAKALVVEAPQLIQTLQSSAASGDQRVLTRGAHTLKGTARVVQFEDVASLSAKVERLSREGKTAEAVSHLDDLAQRTRLMTEQVEKWIQHRTNGCE
ncbi:Signal transduction histidine-protein kinase BarA [Rosistilla carotiformis]|uniref:histidine kinase n=1 Tax=Rosistilla carotiformis TaxID=2528017 RepID=A0A518JZB3_9BACT|nr:response regulator [Rosistilla carotiformis]QDV70897.1 Signal transduction histidine-protein kinase BarA [Rosistilla carotiformis]